MQAEIEEKIRFALEQIALPGGGAARDLLSSIEARRGEYLIVLEVDPAMGPAMEDVRRRAEAAALSVPGVQSALVVLTAERAAAPAPDPHGMNKNPRLELPFEHMIAVASGKGGVGKSTAAFNLAVALSRLGEEVCLLDADIYGPSLPRLAGLTGVRAVTGEDKKIIPPEAHGLRLMSMGFLVEEEKPMIWRGPMIQSAFYQMLRDVSWRKPGEAGGTLIIDMPPGTGDVQLTLAQKVPVTGAVIVSTPQDLALIDARKAVAMFEKTGVKILGLIENMSFYHCPACGREDHVFGHGGAAAEALKLSVPFLGEVPLNGEIRALSDAGQPLPEIFYKIIAQTLLNSVKSRHGG